MYVKVPAFLDRVIVILTLSWTDSKSGLLFVEVEILQIKGVSSQKNIERISLK